MGVLSNCPATEPAGVRGWAGVEVSGRERFGFRSGPRWDDDDVAVSEAAVPTALRGRLPSVFAIDGLAFGEAALLAGLFSCTLDGRVADGARVGVGFAAAPELCVPDAVAATTAAAAFARLEAYTACMRANSFFEASRHAVR